VVPDILQTWLLEVRGLFGMWSTPCRSEAHDISKPAYLQLEINQNLGWGSSFLPPWGSRTHPRVSEKSYFEVSKLGENR